MKMKNKIKLKRLVNKKFLRHKINNIHKKKKNNNFKIRFQHKFLNKTSSKEEFMPVV
jgi:hypothetical protein